METKSLRRGSHRLLVRFSLLIVSLTSFVVTIATTRADAAAELASFSVFDKVDLAQLAQGDAKTAHGPPSSGRYLSVQSCYVTKRTPAQEMAAMRNWNPGQHSELHVYLHNDLGGAPGPASFARLRSAPDTGPVRALSDATQKMSTDLQVSADEAKQPPAGSGGGAMPTGVATYWANLLSARAQAFLSGGSSSQRPYDHTGKAIRPGEELNGMLRQQEKIRHQFSGFLESTGIGRGGGGLRPDLYWELLEVEDQGVLTLGAAYNRAASGGAMQAADTLY